MVPFESFEDGLTGRFLPNARGRLGEAASSFTRWAAKGFEDGMADSACP
jgi:hypothetical protein